MKRKLIKRLLIPALITLALGTGFQSFSQASATPPLRQLKGPSPFPMDDSHPSPAPDFQMLRKDLQSQKKQTIAANMDLTDSEAEKFWPVYDRYAADLAKIYDVKLELIAEYLDSYKTMSGDQAESYIRRRAAAEQDVMALRLKYVPEFRRALSGRQAALFFQIEWRLDLLINLQLAQIQLIDP